MITDAFEWIHHRGMSFKTGRSRSHGFGFQKPDHGVGTATQRSVEWCKKIQLQKGSLQMTSIIKSDAWIRTKNME
ncbi:hypothetical protein CAEBREN_01589 [Caenorhabditis brenneri]|uniref:Uncharacterized protein n=1 Tax=Caenorhabditis brenneri TaxID=135651 RepID=G0NNQ8_CAEBE|nr:hypothetical protein CAEBREN_01589 [Caenorhabditis brenneri]